ncbi:MAG: hypothetical protein ACFUZC_16635 [Chthoniobacteraceae bacterium]
MSNTEINGAASPAETKTEHRSLTRVFADFLGLTAAVQAANAKQLENLQGQIDALKSEIDAHPEVETTASLAAVAVLENAAAQPAETATAAATSSSDTSSSDASTGADASADSTVQASV